MLIKRFSTFMFCYILIFTLSNCANIASDSSEYQKENKSLDYSKKEAPFSLSYSSYQDRINIRDQTFSHTRLQHHFPENSPVAVPDSTSNLEVLKRSPLNQFQLNELQKIVNSGFLKLNDAYGAPQDKRHYPYTIQVEINGQQKKVIYRSNPSFDEAPYAFKTLKSALLNLSKELHKNN